MTTVRRGEVWESTDLHPKLCAPAGASGEVGEHLVDGLPCAGAHTRAEVTLEGWYYGPSGIAPTLYRRGASPDSWGAPYRPSPARKKRGGAARKRARRTAAAR